MDNRKIDGALVALGAESRFGRRLLQRGEVAITRAVPIIKLHVRVRACA